jgi:AraC-like DNA-binding protein
MSVLIRTDHMPARERIEFVQEEVAPKTWVPLECGALGADLDFCFELRTSTFGAIQVNLVTSGPVTVRRTPKLIRRSAPDLLKLVAPVQGHARLVVMQDGRQAHLVRPGDFALYDTRRPFEVRAADVHAGGLGQIVTMHFPSTLLPLPPSQLKQLTAVPMGAGQGIGSLTSQLLTQVAQGIDEYTPVEATRLSTAALEVLATRLAHELDGDGWVPPETHKRALLVRIYTYIQEHLGDPELSPGTVAAAHYISLRYLHKLFQEEGATVAGWIRARRLEACRRELADPALTSRPVAAIAARWGFSSAAHFGQVFRDAHGIPPGEYRLRTQAGAMTGAGAGSCTHPSAECAQR